MSLLGNIVGHAAATVGRAYDYATPGSGTSALTNAGRAVYNPNVVLSNPSGIFTKAVAFTPATNTTSQSTASPTKAGTTDTTSPTTTYTAPSGPSAQDLAAYSTYKNEATNDLNKLLGAYNATKQSLNNQYNTKQNELDSAKANTDSIYKQNVTSQNQNLLRQQNQIRQGTLTAYQNLMNLLGAYGGGGGSVALQWAPTAAQHFMDAQLQGANQTTAGNLQNLNQAYGTYLNQYDQQKKQLASLRNQDLTNADSQYNDTRDKLNLILQRIGDRSQTPADINGALSGINVPSVNYVQPTYTGTTPVYQAPNLSSFEASAPTASFAQPSAVSNSSATPALAYLFDQQQRQQQQPALA